jgi:hypothetical protein
MPSDPAKLARLTESYQRFRAGELGEDELPDLSDVWPDDPQTLAEIGFQTEPAATPAEALVQACGACHNDVLDQSLSRARFSIDLNRMDRAELDHAIRRLTLPLDSPEHMPPREFRQVDPEALDALVRYLELGVRSAADDAFLERAAQLGMANAVAGVPDGRLSPLTN